MKRTAEIGSKWLQEQNISCRPSRDEYITGKFCTLIDTTCAMDQHTCFVCDLQSQWLCCSWNIESQMIQAVCPPLSWGTIIQQSCLDWISNKVTCTHASTHNYLSIVQLTTLRGYRITDFFLTVVEQRPYSGVARCHRPNAWREKKIAPPNFPDSH